MENASDIKERLPLIDNGKPSTLSLSVNPKVNFIFSLKSSVLRKGAFLIPAIFVLVCLGGVVGMYFQPAGLKFIFSSTSIEPGGGTEQPLAIAVDVIPDNPLPRLDVIKALGRLMPYDDIVVIAVPYGANDARIAKIYVNEGDIVRSGQVIAELDNIEQLTSAVNVAKANLQVAEATVYQTKGIIGSSYGDLFAQLQSLEESARIAQIEHRRFEDLFTKSSISPHELEQSKLNVTKAQNALKQTNAQFNRLTGGDKQADVKLALARHNLAKADVARTEVELQKAYVRTPKDGTILSVHARVGERPGNSGIASMGAVELMQAELEVYQTDINHVEQGANVTLSSPALKSHLFGVIDQIGLEVERQTIVGSSPSSHLDARIVRVIVNLDKESSEQARKLSGLEVTGTIERDIL